MDLNPYKSPESPPNESPPRRFRWSLIPEYVFGVLGGFGIALGICSGGVTVYRVIIRHEAYPPEMIAEMVAIDVAFLITGVCFALSSWCIKESKTTWAWISFLLAIAIPTAAIVLL